MTNLQENKKNILFIIGSLNGGGAERVLLHILESLNLKKFKCHLLLGSLKGDYIDNIPTHVNLIDFSSKYHVFVKNIFALNKVIKIHKIDLVVGFMPNANLLALLTKYFLNHKLKIIITEHNNPSENFIKSNSKIKSYLKSIIIKYFYPYSNKIVVVSNGIGEELINKFKLHSDLITTIYNPVDLKFIRNKVQEKPEIFKKVLSEKIIIAVGRLVKQKGYFEMLEIINQLKNRIPIRLLILGEGPLRKKIENRISELNLSSNVDLLGFVDNPWSYIFNSDVYLSTSLWEGFHMTIVESMACGVYPIVSNCNYGPNEIIINDKMGKLLPVSENAKFVDELFSFLKEHKRGCKYDTCIQRSKFFDITKVIKQYTKLFDLI